MRGIKAGLDAIKKENPNLVDLALTKFGARAIRSKLPIPFRRAPGPRRPNNASR